MANHHYVPLFYLKRFCDPETPLNQEPYLWVSARGGTGWKKRAPKNVGAKPGLYAVPTDGGDDEVVEKMFSTIETAVATIYRRRFDIYSAPVGLEERKTFATFVALFAIRSPFYRQHIAGFTEEIAQKTARMLAHRPEAVERSIKKYETETGKTLGLSVKQYQEAVLSDGFKITALPHYITAMSLQQLDMFTRLFFLMRWRFLIAPPGEYFITSDSPAHWQDLTPRPPMLQGHGLAMTNVEVVLPLSKQFCFLGRWRRSTGVVMATAAQVHEITNRTISWSTAELYSPLPFTKSLMDENSSKPLYPFTGGEEPGFVRPPAFLAGRRLTEEYLAP